MNKHDSERISGLLKKLGSNEVYDIESSDIVVYMTCCVREAAETRLMGHVASIKSLPVREGSKLSKRYICIGGCIGQKEGSGLIEAMPHIDVVFGTNNISALPTLLEESIESDHSSVQVLERSDEFSTDLPTSRANAWAAWLPITVGCDNFCTYCIVPYVRGRERSRSFEDIVSEAKGYIEEGVKEITLLGQNVNSYGRDIYGKPRFVDLLDELDALGIERLRFATSHPKDLSDDLIERFKTLPSLMPSLHLPVQSGSNRILESMNRRYTREHYLELIRKLRDARPDIALSTDIIVGFPGETDEDFDDTYDLVKEVGYNQVFTFIYSPREGTPSAKWPYDLDRVVVQERFDRLVDIVQEQAYKANQTSLGSVVPTLIEGTSKRSDEFLTGRTPKNQTVHLPVPQNMGIEELIGTIVDARIDSARTWYLSGEIV